MHGDQRGIERGLRLQAHIAPRQQAVRTEQFRAQHGNDGKAIGRGYRLTAQPSNISNPGTFIRHQQGIEFPFNPYQRLVAGFFLRQPCKMRRGNNVAVFAALRTLNVGAVVRCGHKLYRPFEMLFEVNAQRLIGR